MRESSFQSLRNFQTSKVYTLSGVPPAPAVAEEVLNIGEEPAAVDNLGFPVNPPDPDNLGPVDGGTLSSHYSLISSERTA